MPKRIPNLSETILEQAALLFSQQGYEAVDMKQVAAAAGTSVGNLYNYYKSKPALFLAVFKNWRSRLMESFHDLLEGEGPRREKILSILHVLYDNMANMHGLWHEYLDGRDDKAEFLKFKREKKKKHPWGLSEEELVFLGRLETLITGNPEPGKVHYWAFLLMTTTIQLALRYPENLNDNWQFLEKLVDKI